MKKTIASILLLASSLLINSCSSDEKVIDDYGEQRPVLLASYDGVSTKLALYTAPTGVVNSDDEFAKSNGYTLKDSVSKIAEFRGNLYLVIPNRYQILTIDKQTFKPIDTIDFSSDKYIPADICFANATDSYITLSNANKVCLFDMYYKKIARYMDVGKNPTAIACSGNQVLVTNTGESTVSVVDTRYNTETKKIAVGAYPSFAAIRVTGKECVVVSLGEGKTGVESAKTEAKISIIDIETSTLVKSLDLNYATLVKATEVKPLGLTVSDKDGAVIPCDTYTLRVDLRTRNQVYSAGKYSYSSAIYDRFKDRIIAFTTDKAGVYKVAGLNSYSGALAYQFAVPKTTYLAFPL